MKEKEKKSLRAGKKKQGNEKEILKRKRWKWKRIKMSNKKPQPKYSSSWQDEIKQKI